MTVARCLMAALPIILLAAGCSRKAPPSPDPVCPVKTLVVLAGEEARTRTFPGRVEASNRVELAFQVPGLLAELPVKEGQKVAKGELIAQLRQDEFKAWLKVLQGSLDQSRAELRQLESGVRTEKRQQLEAGVRAAQARFTNAEIEHSRNERLLRSNAVSRQDVDSSRKTMNVAREELNKARQALEAGNVARPEEIDAKESQVRGLEARLVEANIQLADSTLLAPYDGVIARRFVEQNQNVMAKQPIVKFQDVDEIDVAVDVPETAMAADILTADIIEMQASVSGAPGLQFPVHIKEIVQRADPVTQTFRVLVAFKAPPPAVNILPGMTANVSVTYRRASILGSPILVPISAVTKDGSGKQIVWVVDKDMTATRRPVKLGTATGGQLEVAEGLEPGERIAIAGVSFLRAGMKFSDPGNGLGGSQP